MDYAMFLRGINVGGIKVPMAELRECLSELGLTGVKTYLQSGNVTFASTANPKTITKSVEAALSERFSYDAHVLIVRLPELGRIVADFPFPARADHHRYAIFCASTEVAAELAAAGRDPDPELEQVAAKDRVVYWSCPKGSTLDTPFSKVLAKKAYRATTTNRNLNTLEKMLGA